MKLKVGDKVRFLNEAIEGEVTKLLDGNRAEVTDEFGFAHSASEKALVKVEFNQNEKLSEEREENIFQSKEDLIAEQKEEAKLSLLVSSLEKDETIYAAVRLKDERSPLTSDIELFLINNCSYTIAFTVSKKNEDIRSGIVASVLKPESEMLVGVFSQDELHQFEGFVFQFLFFHPAEFKAKPSAEKNLHFTSSDFMGEENREPLNKNSRFLLKPLYKAGTETAVDLANLIDKYQREQEEEMKRKAQNDKSSRPKSRSRKSVLLNKEKTVDLHIEELLKDYSGMSNAQIISYQLNYFLYEMDRAIVNHLKKITFIHGVGEGVLKSAIREELKKYSDVKYGDAPLEKFGYGATEVLFD